ncbi:hypothetical protein ACFQBQ_12840 [Granulicella cerasi]|uniref:Uncharacterized protein n=1 Tax=Granulicella cerasi TaxID=741063 RepID=A0ABW1ZBZ4_9BACT|nr:hypothetical protein [Granulicella cerasi]
MPQDDLTLFETRLKTMLPAEYRERYDEVQPVSMGSAGLKYAEDGRVAWNEIWGSFCDLAMAGGPPHRGRMLLPATRDEVAADAPRYREVTKELCRGVALVTRLIAEPADVPGWIHVDCVGVTMAGWLARAITLENVSAHCQGMVLHLPAGPHFRVEKEVKNVITSIAKTVHYWQQHTAPAQQRAVGNLLNAMEAEAPLLQAPFTLQEQEHPEVDTLRGKVAASLTALTGLPCNGVESRGWLGMDCGSIPDAVKLMRLIVANNVLCRREETLVYLPIHPVADPAGERLLQVVKRAFVAANQIQQTKDQ